MSTFSFPGRSGVVVVGGVPFPAAPRGAGQAGQGGSRPAGPAVAAATRGRAASGPTAAWGPRAGLREGGREGGGAAGR